MKILEHRHLSDLSPAKVQFIRIDPEDRFEITEKGKKYLRKENAKNNKKVIKK